MTAPTFSTERHGDVTCIVLGPEFENLDEVLLDGIRDDLLATAYAADPLKVIIDVSGVKFFGSSFIEVLFRIWNKINGTPDGRFGICGLTKYCAEVLAVTHLDKLWNQYPAIADALADMNS